MAKEAYEYNTLMDSESTSLYKEKGSKFVGYAFHVENEDDINRHLETVKKEHSQARHICYAYTYGIENQHYRANDDGEPSNSAGMPIYNQIQSFELDNVLIVVVRYFGGTKLGVPGLIQAYKAAAKSIIEQSKIIKVEVRFRMNIQCNYDQLSLVYHFLNTNDCSIVDQKMAEDCEIWVDFPLRNKPEVMSYFESQPFKATPINS